MKQREDKKTVDLEDLILFETGDWCYRYQLHEIDDLPKISNIIYFDTPEYDEFFENMLGE